MNSVAAKRFVIDGTHKGLPLATPDSWSDYFFPELLRVLPDGKADDVSQLWPGHAALWRGRLAGMDMAGHMILSSSSPLVVSSCGITVLAG